MPSPAVGWGAPPSERSLHAGPVASLERVPRSPAIVLLSGGLDSATCLAMALADGHQVITLSFRYGQRHAVELEAARSLALRAGTEHVVIDLPSVAFGGSALTDPRLDIPRHQASADPVGRVDAIPVTYVPARNTVFLSLALAVAETRGAHDLFIGVNALDYSGYPDCRPEYIQAFEAMANLATRAAVEGAPIRIHAPLAEWTKAEIIRRGTELGVDYGVTISCYDPTADGRACGRCDSCGLRARGFREAEIPDPTRYADVAGSHL
jgi:7-cyano-7-deazaguanine synthase